MPTEGLESVFLPGSIYRKNKNVFPNGPHLSRTHVPSSKIFSQKRAIFFLKFPWDECYKTEPLFLEFLFFIEM
jgi:hypothetical protein